MPEQGRNRGSVLLRTAGLVWRADRAGTALAGALQGVGVLATLGLVLASKVAFEALLSDGSSLTPRLVAGLAGLAVATAAAGSVNVLQVQQQRLLGEQVSQLVWRRLLRVTGSAPLIRWEDSAWIERLDRIRGNALQRPVVVVTSLFMLFGGLAGCLGLGVVLTAIHPVLLPTFVLAGLPAVVIGRVAARTEFGFAVRSGRAAMRRTYLKRIMTDRQPAAELRSYDAAPFLLARHDLADDEYYGLLRGQVRRRQALGLAATLSTAVALSITLGVIVWLVSRGSISLADAGAAAIGARMLGGQLSGVFAAISGFSESVPFLEDMQGFLDEDPDTLDRAPRRTLAAELVLLGVSFSYPGGRGPAVDDVTLRLPTGRLTAIVGENGSGKTTLAKMVAGLYEPSDGTVVWDGDADMGLHELRSSVSLLPQHFTKFQMSVADNITIADGERHDDGALDGLAGAVNMDDLVAGLPEGFATELGIELGRGTDLSGGQWQRLALARALYKQAPVLVLDEPTAAMDPRAEFELFSDVRQLLAGRTTLMITHRYSSARLADAIYVMQDGRVAEHGSHEDLMALGGVYAELYSMQVAAFGMAVEG